MVEICDVLELPEEACRKILLLLNLTLKPCISDKNVFPCTKLSKRLQKHSSGVRNLVNILKRRSIFSTYTEEFWHKHGATLTEICHGVSLLLDTNFWTSESSQEVSSGHSPDGDLLYRLTSKVLEELSKKDVDDHGHRKLRTKSFFSELQFQAEDIPMPGIPGTKLHSIEPCLEVLGTKTRPKRVIFRSTEGHDHTVVFSLPPPTGLALCSILEIFCMGLFFDPIVPNPRSFSLVDTCIIPKPEKKLQKRRFFFHRVHFFQN